jgi:hypothetical protein
MKQSSLILALLFATTLMAATDQPSSGGAVTKEQCLAMDQEDTSDTLAIPLDDDAYEQCEELERLEQGKQK